MTQPPDDPRVPRILASGTLLGAADRVINRVWRAAETSTSAPRFQSTRRQWLALAVAERQRALGVMLLVAAAIHVGLTATHELPAGWLWLVPPGVAVTIGAVFLLLWRKGSRA